MVLTHEQAKAVGAKLLGTPRNVYREVETVIGRQLASGEHDAVYDQVAQASALFKCDECGTWCDESDKDADFESTCCDCAID
jgi:hypothetical protein